MSSDVKIPDAVMIEAERVNDEIFRIAHDEVHILNHTQRKEAIARALLAAEQRGRKAGQEEAYGAVRASRDMDGSTGDDWDQGYACAFSDALAAIRSLGEKT